MKNEVCVEIMDRYLALDKNERVPLALTCHFLLCRKCRWQIKMLAAAEKAAAAPLKVEVPLTESSIDAVMQSVAPDMRRKLKERSVSMANWIVSGIVMILMLFFSVLVAGTMNSGVLLIAYALLIAFCITVYCSCFVVCNIDFFVKKIAAFTNRP
ncbi:MAG: hypothetical protein K2H09_08165 [Treponemataceae bacterium]|nr:hypothetical protein [Treponemataceae bacterium]